MGQGKPDGFDYTERGQEVHIRHNRRRATTLRGGRAQQFLADIAAGADEQELMARITGNYKRGNERERKQHPRNRRR